MSRWARGEAEIEQMLSDGQLQRVAGAGADGGPWLAKATATIATAGSIATPDPAPPTHWPTTQPGSPASAC